VAGSEAFPLSVRATLEDEEEADRFGQLASRVHAAFVPFAQERGCPPVAIEAVLAVDFLREVREALADANDDAADTFKVERVGGTVAAKNVALDSDGEVVRVIFDAQLCTNATTAGVAWAVNLIAHEFAHPFLSRMRASSGALEGVPNPSLTPTQMARSICRTAADEYRADSLADLVLGVVISVTNSQGTEALRYGDLTQGSYGETVAEALSTAVWPTLPELVMSYRIHAVDLMSMWNRVVQTTDQVFTLLAHAEAEAHSLGLDGPLEAGSATHPASQFLLRDAWLPVAAMLKEQELLPAVADWREAEEQLLDVGEACLFEMWQRLGLRPTDERPDGRFHGS